MNKVWPLDAYDQGRFLTCTAVVVLTMLDYAQALQKYRTTRNSISFTYLAAQKLVSEVKNVDVAAQFIAGLPLEATLQSIVQYGAIRERGDNRDDDPQLFNEWMERYGESVQTFYEKQNTISTKGLRVHRLFPTIEHLRLAIFSGYPIGFAIRIDVIMNRWFESKQLQTNSKFVLPHLSSYSNRIATHAMVMSDADDETKLFKVQNSFGTDFGDNGFCYIRYSDVLDNSFTGSAFYIMSMKFFHYAVQTPSI